MVKTTYLELTQHLDILFKGILLMQLCLSISGALIALISNREDCSNPVRAWLVVNASMALVMLVLNFLLKTIGFISWCIWNIAWISVGSCWVFQDGTCKDQFEYGYTAASMMIISTSFLLSIVLIGACVSGVAICIGYGLMSNYEDID
jgi:hypothetical protein